MEWPQLLKSQLAETYRCTENLMKLVEPDDLAWKPSSGDNWMTTGQLLHHLTEACGTACRGFVTGAWDFPDAGEMSDSAPASALQPAESMTSAASVADALAALAADKQVALEMIEQAAGRFDDPAPAPWDPTPTPLGEQLLGMIGHLSNHRGQLFYYLKLQGKPVNTMHYYGMA